MNRRLVYLGSMLCLVVLGVSSCEKKEVIVSCGFPSGALSVARPVYIEFSKNLRAEPSEDDFQKFVSNVSNYKVSIGMYEGKYIFSFHLKPYHGRHVIDDRGSFIYIVSKSGHIESVNNRSISN
ncbi:MAG TPA: hypothetical protein VF271_11175 [Rhodanobacteraceae bacterium]